jgi:predicted transcriptional regulator
MDPQGNGWTQYQKLVLAELERHEHQMENVKQDILEIKIAQNKLASDMSALQKSIRDLSNTLKEKAEEQKEADKAAIEQRIDVRELKLKFGWLCALIGVVSGAGGSSLMEFIMHLFGH